MKPLRELLRARGRRVRDFQPRGVQLPAQQAPDAQRADYFRELAALVDDAEALVMAHVLPAASDLSAPVEAARVDAADEDAIRAALARAAEQLLSVGTNARIARSARGTAQRVADFQRTQLRRQFAQGLGIDILEAEPNLAGDINRFTADNVQLVRSIFVGSPGKPGGYFDEVHAHVVDAVRRGFRAEDIAETIRARTGVARSSAKLVARDQVGKFYGALNATRQQALGVRRYVWRCVRDNRVREEHVARDGKEYSWDAPPPGGHPGKPINCRCWAEPALDALFEDMAAGAPPVVLAPPAEAAPPVVQPPPTTPLPARGPVRGDGAAVARAHPQLAAILGDKLRVDDYADARVAEQVADLARLPPGLLEHMRESVGDVHVSTLPLPSMGRSGALARLRGVQPRGWPPGATWDTVGGVYSEATGEVVVAVNGRGGGPSTMLHEFGHAVDFRARLSGRVSDTQAWRGVWKDFTAAKHPMSAHPYFNQAPPAGPQELLAEAFAAYYKEGPKAAARQYGPEVVHFVDRYLGPKAWAKKGKAP